MTCVKPIQFARTPHNRHNTGYASCLDIGNGSTPRLWCFYGVFSPLFGRVLFEFIHCVDASSHVAEIHHATVSVSISLHVGPLSILPPMDPVIIVGAVNPASMHAPDRVVL